jgi:hypothetical protein
MTWKRVPASSRLLVHSSSGRGATAVRMLSGTSDWKRELLDRGGVASVMLLGASGLPAAGAPTWPAFGIDGLDDELRVHLPGFRPLGLVLPRQPGRERLSVLGRMTGNVVVVKLGGSDERLEREGTVLEALARNPLPGIHTPEPIDYGSFSVADEPMTFLATTGIALGHQRPAIDEPLRTFERDLGLRLGQLPGGTGEAGNVPVHGDLTPWNLRRTTRGLALFDWEAAGWGDAGSDIALYRTACNEVRRPWRKRRSTFDPIGARA